MNEQTLRTFHPNVRPFIREVMINGRIEVNILEENVPSLAKWDAEDPKSLLHVISELLALYRKHQMGCLSKSQGQIKKQMELLKAELTEGQICMTTQDIEPVDKKIEDQGNNYGKVKKQIGLLKGIAKKEQKYHSHENEPIQDKKIIENLNNNLWSAKKCKVSLLNGVDYSRIYFEYSSLVCQAQVLEEDVEVLIGTRNNKSRLLSGAVNFLIKLKVDFSSLPPIVSNENPGENAAMLLVTFHSPEGSRITPQLHLAPSVEKALGSFQLPPFPPDGSCLMDYVPVVVEQLQEKVSNIANCFEKKKEYFAALFYRLGKSVVEYDGVTFTRATFILEWRDFYFLVHFTLPAQFPLDRPMLLFQSVYHIAYGNPYQTWVDDYPYSPRWLPNEMVDRVYNYILEHAEVFQKKSIQSSQG
ncbi:BRISC and BRCA1-A complex member 2 isoform X2 [Anabrus simplex]|uniref:BRISC and BRCA1-A complex member 2 isoform X2 n=1 Tax=Anabrus simplex TaxID=316456 RepID=UPI0034DD0547